MKAALVITLMPTFVAGWFAAVAVWFAGVRAYRLWLRRMIARDELPAWLLGATLPFRGSQPIPVPVTEFNRFGIWRPLWATLYRSDPDPETERVRKRVVRRGRVFIGIWVAMLVDFVLLLTVGWLTGTTQ